MRLRILIVGSGGREAVIAKKFSESKLKPALFNVGTHYNPQLYRLCCGHVIVTDNFSEVKKMTLIK